MSKAGQDTFREKMAKNRAVTVQETLIEGLPAGIERALRRVLSFHVGEAKAIGRQELMDALAGMGFRMADDRPVRALINELRKRGELICSKGGTGGGYWLAANREEMEEYLEHEVHPRAMDLLETEKALKAAMELRFGAKQEAMF
jgi:hypothetical protein